MRLISGLRMGLRGWRPRWFLHRTMVVDKGKSVVDGAMGTPFLKAVSDRDQNKMRYLVFGPWRAYSQTYLFLATWVTCLLDLPALQRQAIFIRTHKLNKTLRGR